jgi:hypothetical protein
LLPIEAAAVALKLALADPAATVRDAGTVRELLLLASVRLKPPEGAIPVRVTVQALTALGPRLSGLQASEETVTGGAKPMVTLSELPL